MMGGMLDCFGSGFGGFGGFGGLGLIGTILNLAITVGFVVGLVLLVAWLWRRVNAEGKAWTTPQTPGGIGTSPQEILQVRYAHGEINREQYQQMLADLG
jgi:uncharacterized membrane protein